MGQGLGGGQQIVFDAQGRWCIGLNAILEKPQGVCLQQVNCPLERCQREMELGEGDDSDAVLAEADLLLSRESS